MRPYVTIRTPKVIHPGGDFEAEITLDSASAGLRVDRADLTFSGVEGGWLHEDYKTSTSHPIVNSTLVLLEKTRLEQLHRLGAIFRVPPGAPASYGGSRATVLYKLALDIVIPWWLDVHETQEVVVTPAAGPRPPRDPVVSRSEDATGPFLEVSLDGSVFGRGELIEGAFAVGNLGDHRVLAADIALVGADRIAHNERWVSSEAHRINLNAVLSVAEGRAHAFRLRVPRDAPVSFEGAICSLSWALEVRVQLTRASLFLEIPLVIAHFLGDAGRSEEKPARPEIGRQRWREGWRAVADQRGLILDPTELRLSGSLSHADVSVAPGRAEGKRGGLTADLRFTSLGLDLQVERRRITIFADGDSEPAFRRRFVIESREPAQARALLGAQIRQALRAFDEVHLTDDRVRVRSRRSGPDQAGLEAFVARVVALDAALGAAAASVPPPAGMSDFVPAWRSFAAAVGARLELGRMALHDARVEGERFEVTTVHDRFVPELKRTRVRLLTGLTPTAGAAQADSPGDPDEDGLLPTDAGSLARLPTNVRGAIEALERQSTALRVATAAVEVEVKGAIADPASLRPLLHGMLVLLPWIRGERTRGPYR